MKKQEIKEEIVALAEQTVGVELSDTETLKDAGLDSLALVVLITSMEETFGVQFNEDDLDPEKLSGLDDLVELAEKYL